MAIRPLAQVTAGLLAGAALVGIPTWATASPNDSAPASRSDMSSMMTSKQSQEQMVDSMSTLMDNPTMRKQMRSRMSGGMGDTSGMGDMSGMECKMSTHGNSGMDQMHQMTQRSK